MREVAEMGRVVTSALVENSADLFNAHPVHGRQIRILQVIVELVFLRLRFQVVYFQLVVIFIR